MFVYVSCYTKFGNLAHTPSGTASTTGIEVFRFDERTGTLKSCGFENSCSNPSFLCFHPTKDVMYTCSEGITQNDKLWAYTLNRRTGKLKLVNKPQSLHGYSSCYLSIDHSRRNILFTNYWDSSIGCLPIDEDGVPGEVKNLMKTDPVGHRPRDRAQHLDNRQTSAHAHSIILEPSGTLAFVPDLGRDIISEFKFDPVYGVLQPVGTTYVMDPNIPGPHGPRYMVFHPTYNLAFVVMELSSTVAVYRVNFRAIAAFAAGTVTNSGTSSVLSFIKSYESYPKNGPFKGKNTCGRLCISPDGGFVVVSNRGHNSLTVYRITSDDGDLKHCCTVDSGGRTPRHFKFHPKGNFIFSANQDSDNVTVFAFDKVQGLLKAITTVKINSPNFVGCIDERINVVRFQRL